MRRLTTDDHSENPYAAPQTPPLPGFYTRDFWLVVLGGGLAVGGLFDTLLLAMMLAAALVGGETDWPAFWQVMAVGLPVFPAWFVLLTFVRMRADMLKGYDGEPCDD